MNSIQQRIDINSMVSGYLECALFSDIPDDDTAVYFTFENISRSMLKKAYDDCKRFFDSLHIQNIFPDRPDYHAIGIDFWYTRQGHGTGFWDNYKKPYDDNTAELLTDIATGFGECYLYLGDNGKLYID